MVEAAVMNQPIKPITHCYSSRNNHYKALAAIAEGTEYINTVADSAVTGHFFPNKDNKKNIHDKIKVICANNQTMNSVATTKLDIPEVSEKPKMPSTSMKWIHLCFPFQYWQMMAVQLT